MKQSNIFWTFLTLLFVASGSVFAQSKKEKLNERFSVNKDVSITVDTRYADVVFETWNKNEVSVEAYVEGKDASDALRSWDLNVSGNSNNVRITSKGGYSDAKVYDRNDIGNLNLDLDLDLGEIIGQSLSLVEPVMNGLVGPLLEGISGQRLPDEFYEEMGKMKFDHEAYKREGRAYLDRWEKQVDKSYGPEFEEKMEKWEKEFERNSEDWSERLIDRSGIPRWPFKSGGNMTFDSDEYEKDKQAYVNKLNRKYNTRVSVREVDKWLDDVEAWGEDFGKKMEDWGENFGESMEAWGESFGENFGKSMEKWGESFGKDMEKWGENFGKKMERWAEDHEGEWEEKHTKDEKGNKSSHFSLNWDSESNGSKKPNKNVKRIIIIKMPKKAELDLNVRYGKVRMVDAYNAKATISHGSLVATNIDGGQTSFDVSYSPVAVVNWNEGTLNVNHVKECNISTANNIKVTSNSSNVNINRINGAGMISGSFGKLSIPQVSDNFGSLTIFLENSDLTLRLPQSAFNFNYSGDHNDFFIPKQLETKSMKNGSTEMVNGFHKYRSSANTITINAKYSDVVLQ
ncbi:hypothetical protein DCS32_01625 [Dokdonia sp. Dokd-P16]|uniref:hypothetical protein n=1 Tax=Dokdonia sp. Dokd-P16 TaxID=2173169 RepID=UPI000D547C75|nr:hypothetical protein [Dokdonia sp. Dokd-P16]AWH72905.1 hypothetical protein DCS32_01625 [Dokdonia sp. Dokd-P16]